MTSAVFFKKQGLICGFSISGHTDDAGSDEARLVCSAVSSAVYMAANTITEVIGDTPQISVSDGKMSLSMASDGKQASQTVLEGLWLHLGGLQEQYPEFIHIKMEVQQDA